MGVEHGLVVRYSYDGNELLGTGRAIAAVTAPLSGHPPGHPQNTTGGLDAVQSRQIADQQKVAYFAIHLLRPRAKLDWIIAEQQFKTLATNPGTEAPLYFPVSEDLCRTANNHVKRPPSQVECVS